MPYTSSSNRTSVILIEYLCNALIKDVVTDDLPSLINCINEICKMPAGINVKVFIRSAFSGNLLLKPASQ